jgi:hypothetical protein
MRACSFALEALRIAMRDVGDVREAVRVSAARFRRIAPGLLSRLLEGLSDPSAAFAHTLAGVLVAVARAEGTSLADRRQILNGLLAAARDPRNRRPVHEVRSGPLGYETYLVGRLDALLLRTACDLARW